MIYFDSKKRLFHLESRDSSYLIAIDPYDHLQHVYWGKKLSAKNIDNTYPMMDRGFSTNYDLSDDRAFSYDYLPQEITTFGNGDFREPSLVLKTSDQIFINDLLYYDHEIILNDWTKRSEKAQAHGKHDSLKIILKDRYREVYVSLIYRVFAESNTFVRNLEIENKSDEVLYADKLMSFNIDMLNEDYEMLYLSGAWAKERHIRREKISRGIHKLDSKRGISSHHLSPFFAVCDPDSNKHQGNVYSFNLIYSGGFEANIELDSIDQIRLQMGIQSLAFSYEIEDFFESPQVALTYSEKGFNQMMQQHHHFVKEHIIPEKFKEQDRPILINNWEATYFDFDAQKIKDLAEAASEAGIELLVLDDGWFGQRNDDRSSLGDWFVNKEKLPDGLQKLSQAVQEKNMRFGLWIEPEMISIESELYQTHPEYMLRIPEEAPTPSRSQFVLDFSQEEVVDHIYQKIEKIMSENDIHYIKWDMNRYLSDVYSIKSKKANVYHDYILGVYSLAWRLTERFPDVLFEACAGGGGRFDWGMLCFFPQVWTSDNTDAIERLKIQDGSILLFPQSSMGAHVSAVPNHQVNRSTSLDMRFKVSAAFNLGYELDLTEVSQKELETIARYNEWYKKHRHALQWGRFSRLISPFDNKQRVAWQIDHDDWLYLFAYTVLADPNPTIWKIKLNDLDPTGIYQDEEGVQYSGDELMYHGLYLDITNEKDFSAIMKTFRKVN